jgi:hypothetical protein
LGGEFLPFGDPKKNSNATHTKDFCENNGLGQSCKDFEESLSEIAIFTQIGSNL